MLDNVAPHEGKKLKRRLSNIKHSGWSEVVDRMIDQGVLGREKPMLGPTRHPVAPDHADRKVAKERIDNAADQVPAADTVKAAIQAVQTAALAARAGAAVAGGSS